MFPHRRVIKYTRRSYAIPAILAAVVWLFMFVSILFLFCGCGLGYRIHWRMLNHYVNQTSMGRVGTNAMGLDQYDPAARTRNWLMRAGNLDLAVPSWKASSESHPESPRHSMPSPYSPSSPAYQKADRGERWASGADFELKDTGDQRNTVAPTSPTHTRQQERWRPSYRREESDVNYTRGDPSSVYEPLVTQDSPQSATAPSASHMPPLPPRRSQAESSRPAAPEKSSGIVESRDVLLQ